MEHRDLVVAMGQDTAVDLLTLQTLGHDGRRSILSEAQAKVRGGQHALGGLDEVREALCRPGVALRRGRHLVD